MLNTASSSRMTEHAPPPIRNYSSIPTEQLDFDELEPSLYRACTTFYEEMLHSAQALSEELHGVLTCDQILHFSKVAAFPGRGFGTKRNMRRFRTGHSMAMRMERPRCPPELRARSMFGEYSKWVKDEISEGRPLYTKYKLLGDYSRDCNTSLKNFRPAPPPPPELCALISEDERVYVEHTVRRKDLVKQYMQDLRALVREAHHHHIHTVLLMGCSLEPLDERGYTGSSPGYGSNFLRYLDAHKLGGDRFQAMVHGDVFYREVVKKVHKSAKRTRPEDQYDYHHSPSELKRQKLRIEVPPEILDAVWRAQVQYGNNAVERLQRVSDAKGVFRTSLEKRGLRLWIDPRTPGFEKYFSPDRQLFYYDLAMQEVITKRETRTLEMTRNAIRAGHIQFISLQQHLS